MPGIDTKLVLGGDSGGALKSSQHRGVLTSRVSLCIGFGVELDSVKFS